MDGRVRNVRPDPSAHDVLSVPARPQRRQLPALYFRTIDASTCQQAGERGRVGQRIALENAVAMRPHAIPRAGVATAALEADIT